MDHLVVWEGEYRERARQVQGKEDYGRHQPTVYLPAIKGHVLAQMLCTFSMFLDFCYLVCCNIVDKATLTAIDTAFARYHLEHTIFIESGVCLNSFCLPRQHSLTHYCYLIQEFSAPNGLCSSMTESQHIKAVKQSWRWSSRYEALSQMLTINDRLDKLVVARVDFVDRGMMADRAARPLPTAATAAPAAGNTDDDDDGGASDERKILGEVILAKTPLCRYPRNPDSLAQYLNLPHLIPLICRFLYLQDNPDHDFDIPLANIPLDDCPDALGRIKVFPSAVAKFYAPSDQSGITGMLREHIRAVHSWHGGTPRYDCVFIEGDPELPGFRGLIAARVLLFPTSACGWYSQM
ncbi:hypothetical protein B0H10DRAFT_1951013 [Mycena sp. CBHHK59/15]|nr:hypothetical protein B0H10DRAFT_1952761 [Mycena sp. CBHHK59/15]KAJ6613988.1 hypothetical protein B0H10DRAFT_1951013 [Mycena sp. CBHHK59/15]